MAIAPQASVIILTYSHAHNIPAIVNRLRGQNCEIIIADDGLDGLQVPSGCKHYTHERIMPWQASKTRNGGALLATTPYLLFLDDDFMPCENWIAEHVKTLQTYDVSIGLYDPEAVVIGGESIGMTRQQAVDQDVFAIDALCYAGNFGIRADAWRGVGGFDERYGGNYGHEDTDLGRMLRLADASFALSPKALARALSQSQHKSMSDIGPNRDVFLDKWQNNRRVMMTFPGHNFSTYEVARGYRNALRRVGYTVIEFAYHDVFQFCHDALEAKHGPRADLGDMAIQLASQQLAAAILDNVPEVIVNVCGMSLHPVAYRYAYQLGVPMIMVLTESPYLDKEQAEFIERGHVHAVTVNERASLEFMRGMCRAEYMPHAYDPLYHYPRPTDCPSSDVVFVGTMYEERVKFFESMNCTDIALDLVGSNVTFLGHGGASVNGGIPNTETVERYRASKIGLTLHRASRGVDVGANGWALQKVAPKSAYSLGPRTFELAATGLFQIADDDRQELQNVFGDTVPTFSNPTEAEKLIRYYLACSNERNAMAAAQRARVSRCTFADRARAILCPLIEEVI